MLAREAYGATRGRGFGKDALLAGRIQAAASSTMAYIAEGFSRKTRQEFITFLHMAASSTAEIQSHLYVALDQGYIGKARFKKVYEQADRTTASIQRFIRELHGREAQPPEKTGGVRKRAKSKTKEKDDYIDASDYMEQID